jgi:hypothetical protein
MNLSPSAPVFGEQFRRELLPAVIAHDKAGFQFIDRPRRREAAVALSITGENQLNSLGDRR